ncbi:ANTAR domain-containing protein [Marinobacter sp. M3C]|jgi:AmiR/NasT family two-component response regulator|uniref:ANTAR domain-containing response regulator n=1 Tax=Marinobacter sp. M3C TaxID=2917715 RepID=UPI00200C5221|nr:ANTAR domain-containing protein [Marinobacter sp. M3C]UQG60917.1 ANTAR domain-containing protein [Marinobacter sp. M3C]
MNKSVRRSFRGHHALIISAGRKDGSVLKQQLTRFGVDSSHYDGDWTRDSRGPFDLVFFDAEAGRGVQGVEDAIASVEGPVLALVGSDTPSALNWVVDRGIHGYLTKPLRGEGILAGLMIAYHAFDEHRTKVKTIQHLEEKVRARQFVCTAVIELHYSLGLTVNEAFQLLRTSSMHRRLAVETLSAMIVAREISTSALITDIQDRNNRVRKRC